LAAETENDNAKASSTGFMAPTLAPRGKNFNPGRNNSAGSHGWTPGDLTRPVPPRAKLVNIFPARYFGRTRKVC